MVLRMDKNSLCPAEMKGEEGEWAEGLCCGLCVRERHASWAQMWIVWFHALGGLLVLEEKTIQAVWAQGARASSSQCPSVSLPWPTFLCQLGWMLIGCSSTPPMPPPFGSLQRGKMNSPMKWLVLHEGKTPWPVEMPSGWLLPSLPYLPFSRPLLVLFLWKCRISLAVCKCREVGTNIDSRD